MFHEEIAPFFVCSSRKTQGSCSYLVFGAFSQTEQVPKLRNLAQSTLNGTQPPFHSHHPPITPEIHRLVRSSRLQGALIPLTSLSH